MLLVFLFIIILFQLLILSLRFEIEVKKLVIDSNTMTNNIILNLRVYILNNIKILDIDIKNNKLKDIYEKQKENSKKVSNDLKEILNAKVLDKIRIKKLNLNMNIGFIDVISTSIIVSLISTIISIGLSKIKKENKELYFRILPNYNEELYLKLKLECIISIKMIHIINIMWILIRKRDDKNARTSNRRAYAYSYE